MARRASVGALVRSCRSDVLGQSSSPALACISGARCAWIVATISSMSNPTYVMQQLGHTDPAFALRAYSLMMRRSEEEREALKALVEGRVFAGNSQGTPDPAPDGVRSDRL